MRTQHFLFLSSIALSSPALAAEPKPAANANGNPGAAEAISRTDAAGSTSSSDEMIQNHPARKNRVRHTFAPSSKRM